jgi:CubicO group peptidase (beta-lactamase class C family)
MQKRIPADPAPIDALLAAAVADAALPCVVAMAANRRGLIYEGAFGTRTAGLDAPVDRDTTFRLHSMTKAVTAAAMMQLVEQGKADLDAHAARWLPELADAQVMEGFDAEGQPLLRPARTPITLRHLLTHTAGFSYDIWNANTLAYQKATGFPGPFSGRRAVFRQPLAFEPGSRWHYSIGIDCIGRIVEEISGVDLETYFRLFIFAPLGMQDTTFLQNDAQRARRVTMHKRQPDGSIAPFVLDRPETTEYFVGGGGLFGTVPDFLAFTSALLNDGGAILRPETVALMAANHIAPLPVEPMVTNLPNLSETCEFWPGMTKGWGLSFLINLEDTPQGRAAGSLAWAGLSNLYFWIDRQKGITGVFASQMLPYFDARAVETFQRFERAIYNAATPS